MGLTFRDVVALKAMLRSPFHQKQLGFAGSWNTRPDVFTPFFYKLILSQQYTFDGTQVCALFLFNLEFHFILIFHNFLNGPLENSNFLPS